MKIIVRVVLIFLLAALFLFLAALIFMLLSRQHDFYLQGKHFSKLVNQDEPVVVNGGLVNDRGSDSNVNQIPDVHISDSTPINRIRVLATHNSYRKQPDFMRLFFVDIGEPGEADRLKYSHKTLYEQLNLGVRSFEFDLRVINGRFQNNHVPLVDDRSVAPDFILALKEMKLWSERNTTHVPVTVIVELKQDWKQLSLHHQDWAAQSLVELDAIFANIMSDSAIRPDDIQGDYPDLRTAVIAGNWPLLKQSRGKFILVLMMDDSDSELYNSLYSENPRRYSFIMPKYDSPEAAFIIHNEPDIKVIRELVRQGFIVRTRADEGLELDAVRKAMALASGAQIVSTDFPQGYESNSPEYSLSWKEIQ